MIKFDSSDALKCVHVCLVFAEITLPSEQRGDLKNVSYTDENVEKQKQLKDVLFKSNN